jgi:hypothetical protein
LAGALAAQKIADRSAQRESLLLEIRRINTAIMLSYSIVNAGLSLKKQYVKDICSAFANKKAELAEFKAKRAAGQIPADLPFEFQADFRSLQMPLIPSDLLRTQVIEGISIVGRPLTAAISLIGAIESLADTIRKRNELIERFRSLGAEGAEQLPAFYFGMPYRSGHISTEYPDCIEALQRLTDDVIFFSELLGKDLMDHGKAALDRYKKIAKVRKEKISQIDFSDAHQQGLMPNSADYADWLRGFKSKSTEVEAKPGAA